MNNQHTKKEPTIESKKEMKKRLKTHQEDQHTMKKSNTKKRERPNS